MPLTDDDVREILRIVDSSPLREIRVQTDGFSLHVVKDGGDPDPSPSPDPNPNPSRRQRSSPPPP